MGGPAYVDAFGVRVSPTPRASVFSADGFKPLYGLKRVEGGSLSDAFVGLKPGVYEFKVGMVGYLYEKTADGEWFLLEDAE